MPVFASSAIRGVEYDAGVRELYITFTSGTTYTYWDVPPRVYRDLLAAPSKGRYFNEHIRDTYSRRLPPRSNH